MNESQVTSENKSVPDKAKKNELPAGLSRYRPKGLQTPKKFICIEINNDSVNWIQVKINGALKVVNQGKCAFNKHNENEGDLTTEELQRQRQDTLQAHFKEHKLTGSPCVIALPSSAAIIKTMDAPLIDDIHELTSLIQLRAQAEMSLESDEAIDDYMIMGVPESDDQPVKILLSAALKKPLYEHVELLENAGLKPFSVTIRGICDWLAVTSDQKALPSEGELHSAIHLRDGLVDITLYDHQSILFTRSIILDTHASETEQWTDTQLENATNECTRVLMSHLSVYQGAIFDTLHVSGCTGYESILIERLKQRLHANIQVWNPSNIKGYQLDCGALTLIGLAQSMNRFCVEQINFLTPKKPQPKRNLTIPLATVAALLVIAMMGYGYWAGLQKVNAAETKVKKLADENEVLKEQFKATQDISKQARRVEEWTSKQENWTEHFTRISAALPNAKDTYLTSFNANESTISIKLKYTEADILTQIRKNLTDLGYQVSGGADVPKKDNYGYANETSFKLTANPEMLTAVDTLTIEARPTDDDSINLLKKKSSTKRRR